MASRTSHSNDTWDTPSEARSGTTSRSRASSHTTTASQTPRIAVNVELDGGERFGVPLLATARVQDLQFEALRRAAKHGIDASPADSQLWTTGPDPSILDEEDYVADLLPLTIKNTFTLRLLRRANTTPAPSNRTETTLGETHPFSRLGSPRPATANNALSVRWITVEDALGPHPLKRLGLDKFVEGPALTIAELYEAAARFIQSSTETRGTGPRSIDPTSIRLWSKYGPLSRKSDRCSMRDLDFGLDPREPLDIFVQAQGPPANASIGQVNENFNPGQRWNLDVSLRGLSTLITSLQILIKEIHQENIGINSVLDTLLGITRFPPVLLAFTHLHDIGLEAPTSMGHLHLVIDVFSALCNSMVPEWMCATEASRLEGARHVVSWIHSLCVTAEAKPNGLDKIPCHVYRAQTETLNTATISSQDRNRLFSESASFELDNDRSCLVSLETPIPSSIRGMVLSAALHMDTPRIFHYYTLPSPSWAQFMQSPPMKRPTASDFDYLMLDANASPVFRMVNPMKLGACLAADLPVVTLSDQGFVSRYDQEDVECSERQYYLWNCVAKKVVFKAGDHGQQISEKLEPIIAARKKGRTWEIDSWTEWTEAESHGSPDESIVICVDSSWSMDEAMPAEWNTSENNPSTQPSRLHEVKDFFNHFSTRLSAYNLATHTGLVTFSEEAKVVQPLSALQIQFTRKLDSITGRGMTAIYDALSHACDMLVAQKVKFPATKCRIILLTDGEDNMSKAADARNICNQLHDNDIVLDAIVIGTDSTTDLFKIARSTGGYAFKPATQTLFFQLFLLETLIDIRTRPEIGKQRVLAWDTFKPKEPDMKDEFSFPPCRPHPNLKDTFIDLKDAWRYWGKSRVSKSTPASPRPGSFVSASSIASSKASSVVGGRLLLSEVKAMVKHEHEDLDVYVSERNMGFWKVVMQGPRPSPYEGGVFLLYVDVGLDFPRVPPGVRFITPILHPNISKHGRICHPIFDREWTGSLHIHEILAHIYGMLTTLESRDTIDPIAALKFYTDPDEGRRQVRTYIERFAVATRTEHRKAITADNDDISSISSSSSSSTSSSSSSSTTSTVVASSSSSKTDTIRMFTDPDHTPPYPNPPASSAAMSSSYYSTTSRLRAPAPAPPQPPPVIGSLLSTLTKPTYSPPAQWLNTGTGMSRNNPVDPLVPRPPPFGGVSPTPRQPSDSGRSAPPPPHASSGGNGGQAERASRKGARRSFFESLRKG